MKRQELITIIEAALTARHWTYARDVALALLEAQPNDLEARYGLARALATAHPEQAIASLQRLVAADGQDADAQLLLADLLADQGLAHEADLARAAALAARPDDVRAQAALQRSPDWLGSTLDARRSLQRGDVEAAFQALYPLAQARPTKAGATHPAPWLCLLEATWRASRWDELRAIATRARSLWPDAVLPGLLLGAVLMRQGEYEPGMVLLHNAAALDSGGQVPIRLWGPGHPYRHLWPPPVPVELPGPLPVEVGALLGRNQLPGGPPVDAPARDDDHAAILEPIEDWMADLQACFEAASAGQAKTLRPRVFRTPRPSHVPKMPATDPATPAAPPPEPAMAAEVEATPTEESVAQGELTGEERVTDQSLHDALTKLAAEVAGLKRTPGTKSGARQRVHIILSHWGNLEARYGRDAAARLDARLRDLVLATEVDTGAMTDVIYVDREISLAGYELTPLAGSATAAEIKGLLAAIDDKLQEAGGAVGSVLIVGDDAVVPFHRLPNPVGDGETEIVTDVPYTTCGDNPLLGERAVGRFPQSDVAGLTNAIQRAIEAHRQVRPKRRSAWSAWIAWLVRWVLDRLPRRSPERARPAASLGYTASVWQSAAKAVYAVLGAAGDLHTSPPVTADHWRPDGLEPARYGYFNLHGLQDVPYWYGQRDAASGSAYPDFPIALSPDDVVNGGRAPRVVFTEACYGAHVSGKSAEDALALRFMDCGTVGFVGATGIAYGSISTPLTGADLLARRFWERLLVGASQGAALRDARIIYAREMLRRQGYLDPDDQKTLLGFVLYGDPTISPEAAMGKSMPKHAGRAGSVKLPALTLAPPSEPVPVSAVSKRVIQRVKGLMAPFVPGAHEAEVDLAVPKVTVGERHAKGKFALPAPGMILTLRKEHQLNDAHAWQQVARITLSDAGKVTKVVITRGGR